MHQHRIVRFGIRDFIIDYEAVCASLNKACHRDGVMYRVAGLCQLHDEVVFSLEPDPSRDQKRYVLAPFMGDSMEDVIADIVSRHGAGFATRGMVRIVEDECIGLFEMPERAFRPELITA